MVATKREMLNIMGKEIILDKSKILYDRPFSEQSINEDWEVATGEWWLEKDWLTGRFYGNGGGYIYSKGNFQGDIMIDFFGRTVPPCENDLNFTWHTEGWDFMANDAGKGYIAGIQGWYAGKTGIEKYPECNIQATTGLLDFVAGETYHIQAGTIQNMCFIFINGRLAVELKDPMPFDMAMYGKVGIGTYCSYIQVKSFKVYGLFSEDTDLKYTPNF